MSKFFKHAPVQDTLQKRLSEAVGGQRHVLSSLPWGQPVTGAYAYPALLGPGVAVAICPDRFAMARSLDFMARAGIQQPEVAVFEPGTDVAALKQQVARDRVRLIFTTPDRFSSLNLLDILVHSPLSFVVVEEADRLLPSMPGHGSLEAMKEGLSLFRQLPALMLMVPPMAPARLRELAALLRLPSFQLVGVTPDWDRVRLSVRFLVSEAQKLRVLTRYLAEPSPGGRPRPVIVHTAHPAEAEKLAAILAGAGLDPVWSVNSRQNPSDVAAVAQVLAHRPHAVVVSAGEDFRHWQALPDTELRVVYWSPPASMDELLATLARTAPSGGPARVEGLILHTRDDYYLALDRLLASPHESGRSQEEKAAALQQYRRWLFSAECRLQTLVAYYQGTRSVELPPCGGCDCCRPRRESWLQKALRRWLY